MKVGSKHVTFAKVILDTKGVKVTIGSDVFAKNVFLWCLECDSIVMASHEESHRKFHENLYELEERLEELEKK